jgi:murein DD-endopeptidase MepM/ murein hydrolase activator NlpD
MKRRFLPLAAVLLPAISLTAPAALAESLSEATVHVVKPGETLNGIANRSGVSPKAIAAANNLSAPYLVRIGQKLTIPRSAAVTKPGQTAGQATRGQAATISPELETVHVVRPGETLGGIANRAKVPRILIAEANGLQPPYLVKTGQKLHIPRTRHHTVQAGETGFSLAYKYGVPWEQIALANSIETTAPIQVGRKLLIPTLIKPTSTEPAKPSASDHASTAALTAALPGTLKTRFAWPLSGTIRRDFRTGANYHDGLDITAPEGARVNAAAAGTVIFAGQEQDQFGNLVVLDHGDGWFTAYGFLSHITVKQGAKVTSGERIGLVGSTGKAKGSELHFEVRRDGKPVNALDELPKAP